MSYWWRLSLLLLAVHGLKQYLDGRVVSLLSLRVHGLMIRLMIIEDSWPLQYRL